MHHLLACVIFFCKLLKEQDVDGDSFLSLTKTDFQSLKIKMGPIMKLCKIIKEHAIIGEYIVPEIQPPKNLMDTDAATAKTAIFEAAISMPNNLNTAIPSTSAVLKTQFSPHGTVRSTLEHHQQGYLVLEAIEKSAFGEESRKLLVRIVVAALIDLHETFYPPDEAKWNLSKAIVTEFPSLKNNSGEYGGEHYFDRKTRKGFIEMRIQNTRKKLPDSEKKYTTINKGCRRSVSKENNYENVQMLSEEDLKRKVYLMEYTLPSLKDKTKVSALLEETFTNRRHWIISDNPTINEIYEKYPRLFDYNGEMIDLEFEMMMSEADIKDTFVGDFPAIYALKILSYCKAVKNSIFKEAEILIKDENLRALVVLPALLPNTNFAIGKRPAKDDKSKNKGKKAKGNDGSEIAKCSKSVGKLGRSSIPDKALLTILPVGTNIDDYVKTCQKESKASIQPYLILIKNEVKDRFFIQADGHYVQIADYASPIKAFDLLYKLHYVLNVHFAPTLTFFYNFIECYLYETSKAFMNSVQSLQTVLTSFRSAVENKENPMEDSD